MIIVLFVGDEELCLQDLTEDIMELDSKGNSTHEVMEQQVWIHEDYSMLFYVFYVIDFVFNVFKTSFCDNLLVTLWKCFFY